MNLIFSRYHFTYSTNLNKTDLQTSSMNIFPVDTSTYNLF